MASSPRFVLLFALVLATQGLARDSFPIYGNVVADTPVSNEDRARLVELARTAALRRIKSLPNATFCVVPAALSDDHVELLRYSQANDGNPSPILIPGPGEQGPTSLIGAAVGLDVVCKRLSLPSGSNSTGNTTEVQLCSADQLASEGITQRHSFRVDVASLGMREDVVINRHTWSSSSQDQDAALSLRIASLNTWNSNPPRWLWRHPAERLRQYALRMTMLSDLFGGGGGATSSSALPDIVAFQEVRYDSTLGGFDSFSGIGELIQSLDERARKKGEKRARKALSDGLKQVEEWRRRSKHDVIPHKAYLQQKKRLWDQVTSSPHFHRLIASHPESEGCNGRDSSSAAAINPFDCAAAAQKVVNKTAPTTLKRLKNALKRSPHAQIEHLFAALPYQYVSQPAQLYLDPQRWNQEGEPHRDEEGPAIFSRHPIVSSSYLLLSKAKSEEEDPQDTHQRVCLHALIAVPLAVPVPAFDDTSGNASSSVTVALLDVFSVHLPLSEKARNRGVREIAAFMKATAVSPVDQKAIALALGLDASSLPIKTTRRAQVLAGDMNAEPHEEAMRWLTDVGGGGAEGDEESSLPRLCEPRKGVFVPCPQTTAETAAPETTSITVGVDGSTAALQENSSPAPSTPAPSRSSRLVDAYRAHRRLQRRRAMLQNATTGEEQQQRQQQPADDIDDEEEEEEEFPPGMSDAAVKRYFYTFPSDNPSKRIDMVLLSAESKLRVRNYFLAGQDAMPGSDSQHDGSGAVGGTNAGMVGARSPIWPSDHRAVVVDLDLEP